MNTSTRRMTAGIMLALILWGIYLAIGSTGMFVQDSMMDVRKSAIVVVCVALFLGLWSIVLFGHKAKQRDKLSAESTPAENSVANDGTTAVERPRLPWSRPGLVTVGLAAAGVMFWFSAIASWNSVSLGATTILGWLAAFCIMGTATAGMITLSEPRRRRGKWFGLLALGGFAGALIVFMARMSP